MVLQQLVGSRWVVRSHTSVRGGTFRLHWRAPRDPAIVVLRVALLRHGKARAYSASRRLHVSAPVRVLTATKLTAVPAPGAAGAVRYAGSVAAHPGDIVAAGISTASPYGFLGEVTSVAHHGGETVLQAKPTSLLAAVPEGTINASVDSSSGLATASSVRGGARAKTAAGGLRESIAKSLSCTGGVAAHLSGSVSLTTSANFSAHWSLFHGIDRASVTGTATASAELGASVDASASCTLAKTGVLPHPWTLTPIEFQVGPIPVVLVPRVQIYVSASGMLGARVSTGVHGSLSATAGLSYDHGKVSPIASNSLNFGYEPPTLSSSATLGGRVIPTLDLLLYGVAGPEISFSTGLDLAANPAQDPWWTLTAPVDLEASLKVPELGLETGQLHVYHHVFAIAQAPARPVPPPPPPPPPPPAERTIGFFYTSPDLACTLATNEDLYDEFYTSLEAPNDACGTFLSIEGELYGPESIPAGSDLGGYISWTPIEQQFSGEGTAASPNTLLTTVEAGGTGVRLVETDRWIDGGSSVDSSYAISGEGGDTRAVRLYRAADCYVGNSDVGLGAYDSSSQTVGCLRSLEDGGVLAEQLQPLAPSGATSTEDFYANIWSDLATQQPLPAGCRCGEEIDDGVATSWGLGLHGTSPITASSRFAFVAGG